MVDFLLDLVLSLEFLLLFDGSESVDLHHEVLLLLLFNKPAVDLFLLGELLVSDGDHLGIHDHGIHLLDIISVLIPEIRSLLDNLLLPLSFQFLLFSQGNILLLSIGDPKHLLFLGNSSSELLLFLFLVDSLLLELLFLGENDSIIL